MAENKLLKEAKNELKEKTETPSVSIGDLFLQHVSGMEIPTARKYNTDVGKQLFTFEDVFKTSHPLSRLMRMILASNGVTIEEFDKKHHAFAEAAGLMTNQINYNRNNIKKAISKPKVSYWMFEQVINAIFGYGLKDIHMKLVNPNTGEIEEYSLSDIEAKGKELYKDILPPTLEIDDDEAKE